MNKVLYLVRGVPGSGKTTLAHTMTDVVFSADDFFMVDGEYQFNQKKLSEAHNHCKARCEAAMQSHEPKIAVANTFTREWEMKPYFELAERYGYQVFSIIVENRHGSKNVHGVPDEAVQRMKNRFEIQL